MSHSLVPKAPGNRALALLLAASFAACADPASPDRPPATTPPTANLTTRPTPAGHGSDAEFARLARQMPGFGGMYFDRAGRLTVAMKPGAAGFRQAAADVLGQLRSLGSTSLRGRLSQAAAPAMMDAQYDFGQLLSLKDRAHAAFVVKGVVYIDVDEAANRVRVAITPQASQAAVERVLVNAGVPRGAFVISRSSAISPVKTLLDRFRPVPGAVLIEFPDLADPRFVFLCTLGFNARLAGHPGENFFVTASHCSDVQGGNQHTHYSQPELRQNPFVDRIGTEFKDPVYDDPGGQCFEGFVCRLSDALLARYNGSTTVQLGKIARTTFMLNRLGSIEIDPKHSRWNIVTEFPFPFLGETAHKVGSTSGWTAGTVVATCVDVLQSGSNIVKLCQDIVAAGVRGGDSGSPVFERLGGSDVALTGLLWGGGTDGAGQTVFVFSAMENIEFELGQLATSASESAQ
jgi:hypothetical protein